MTSDATDFRHFETFVRDCMRQCGQYESSSYSLESTDFRAYQLKLGLIRTLSDFPRLLETKYVPIQSLYTRHLQNDMLEYFNSDFPRHVLQFRADNKVWEQFEFAYSFPEVYIPDNVVTVRRRTEHERPRRPIVYGGNLYTSGLDHFMLMWGQPWERDFNEKAITPEALCMLVAIQSINDKVERNADDVPVQLIPFEISPSGELLLGGLQTDAFLPWDGDCLWLQSFIGSPDDYRIIHE